MSASATSSTTATRSLTPQVLTETPKRRSASTLSPSVTATLRMLSPKRASFIVDSSARPTAARAQTPTRRATSGSSTCPATVLRVTPSRVWTAANSRSPWAAWLRFMKSMSISAHGSAWLACVCRCSNGLRRWSRPVIHIFAGLNVCIHAMTPTQASSDSASISARRIAAVSVSTGLVTTRTGTSSELSRARTMSAALAATWSRTSGP